MYSFLPRKISKFIIVCILKKKVSYKLKYFWPIANLQKNSG